MEICLLQLLESWDFLGHQIQEIARQKLNQTRIYQNNLFKQSQSIVTAQYRRAAVCRSPRQCQKRWIVKKLWGIIATRRVTWKPRATRKGCCKTKSHTLFLTLGWQISRPLYMIPTRKIVYTEWSRSTQTVRSNSFSLYMGHLINLLVSGNCIWFIAVGLYACTESEVRSLTENN